MELVNQVGGIIAGFLTFGSVVAAIVLLWTRMSNKVNSFDERIGVFENIKDALDSLLIAVQGLVADREADLTSGNSPVRLQEDGEKIAQSIHAQEIVQQNFSELKALTHADNLEYPYDIQEQCTSLLVSSNMENILNPSDAKKIKDYAYESGTSTLSIYRVLGIVLRDEILREKGHEVPSLS